MAITDITDELWHESYIVQSEHGSEYLMSACCEDAWFVCQLR